MLRVLGVSARSCGCCQTTQTWSRILYYKLQCRLFHQSALLTCSQDDAANQKETFKPSRSTEARKSSRQSYVPKQPLFKPRIFTDEISQQGLRENWKSNLDDEDTFGSLLESPEFQRKSGYGKGHFNKKKYEGQHTKYGVERKRIRKQDQSASEKSRKWSDTFGLMSKEGDETTADLYTDDKHGLELMHDEMAHKPHIPLGTYNRKHSANWYSRRIMKLGSQGKVREAIDVFDRWMMKEDRVKPTAFEFTVLINVLGQVGYTKKAFKLYQQMLRMRIKDIYSPHLFTSLFNACANSPWPEDGLKRAVYLRTRMLVKDIKPNYIVYNAMIKAFGMCGDINTAFALADEAAHFYRPNNNLLASLLVACITDKESGFRHAILVWRKMKKMGVKPELKDYCLLLRAVNECGIGNPELAKDLLLEEDAPSAELALGERSDDVKVKSKKTLDSSGRKKMTKKERKKLMMFNVIDTALSKYIDDDGDDDRVDEIEAAEENVGKSHLESIAADDVGSEKKVEGIETNREIPDNLEWWQMDVFLKKNAGEEGITAVAVKPEISAGSVLDPHADFSQGIPLDEVIFREDRLALIGGYKRLLQALEENGFKPNIVFFMQLMLSTPAQYEDSLLDEMDMANVKPDITFYNLLLRKRAVRYDFVACKRLVRLIEEHDLVPDIRTYGCLALTCSHFNEGMELLRKMEIASMEPNVQIMTALLAASGRKFQYKLFILKKMEQIGIKPEKKMLDTVERQISQAKRYLADQEKRQSPGFDVKRYGRHLEQFVSFYDQYCQRTHLAQAEHPWAPYTQQKENSPGPGQGSKED